MREEPMIASFEMYSYFALIGIFTDKPGNGLASPTQAHIAQGFSWRPGSVLFLTASQSGPMFVEVELTAELQMRQEALRIIQVPFVVDDICMFTSAMSFDDKVCLPEGNYALVFQHWWHASEEFPVEEMDMWCVFSFVPHDNPQPAILRADPRITIPDTFVMEAELA